MLHYLMFYVTLYYVILYNVMSYYIILYNIMLYYILKYTIYILWWYSILYILYYGILNNVMLCDKFNAMLYSM